MKQRDRKHRRLTFKDDTERALADLAADAEMYADNVRVGRRRVRRGRRVLLRRRHGERVGPCSASRGVTERCWLGRSAASETADERCERAGGWARGDDGGSPRVVERACRDAGALRRPCGSEAGAVQERSEPCCAVLRAERTWTRCRQERGAVQGAGLGRSGRFHRRRTQKFAKCRSNTRAEGQREQAHGLCRRTYWSVSLSS